MEEVVVQPQYRNEVTNIPIGHREIWRQLLTAGFFPRECVPLIGQGAFKNLFQFSKTSSKSRVYMMVVLHLTT